MAIAVAAAAQTGTSGQAPIARSQGFTVVQRAVLRNGFSIQHDRRQQMQDVTRLFLSGSGYVDVPTSEIAAFERENIPVPPAGAPSAAGVDELVHRASQQHKIDPDLIHSLIRAESGYNPRAVSPKGAQGLMQLMPQTASELGVKDSFAPAANIDGGTRYLSQLLALYNNDMKKALAAYNAGPQRVAQYRGVPPYRETRKYVSRVITDFNRKKLAQRAKQPQLKAAKQGAATRQAAAPSAP
ncbi:MAG TPA: lytic transglycosylase domain-containing protein [Terriglobales bacterium]|nr:lytic transglycosylase domain-containing protein [Terriglobales bacterium]